MPPLLFWEKRQQEGGKGNRLKDKKRTNTGAEINGALKMFQFQNRYFFLSPARADGLKPFVMVSSRIRYVEVQPFVGEQFVFVMKMPFIRLEMESLSFPNFFFFFYSFQLNFDFNSFLRK